MIDKFLDVMGRSTMLELLDQLWVLNKIKDISYYFEINNSHPAIVRTHIFRMTQRIHNFLPRYANRIQEIQ